MQQLIRAVTVGMVALAACRSAWALGFRNPDQGARATGQGEAFVAQADDASAIYYNPAGLTQVEGTQFTSGMYLSFPNIRFHPVGGGELSANDDMLMLPHFYAASDLGLPKWRFGLGFNIPFGTAITWGKDSPISMLVDKSTMAIYNIVPTVAYQINDQLSLGAGLNIYYGDLLTRSVPLFPFPNELEFRGDGLAAGATVGLLWKPHWQHSFGVVYRSPFSLNFEGNVHLQGVFGPSAANLTMDFPQSVALGYAFRPAKKWKLEVDVEWTNWDTLNAVVLHAPGTLADGTTTLFDWQDSWYYEFGTEYEINERWQVRAGYIFSENTVPDATFSPYLPDSDRHIFSVGLTFQTPRFVVNATYQYSLSADRTIGGGLPMLNGEWKSDGHAIMLTSTLRF